MKKVHLLVIAVMTLLFAYCGTTKVVSTKKLPANATNAVIRAQNVSDYLKTMNPEIPLEEHAYVMMTDSFKIEGLSGRIGVYPPGEHVFRLTSPYFDPLMREILAKQITVSFEAGEYYSFKIDYTFRNLLRGSMETYVLADEVKLERAKQDVAGIKEYSEYMKNYPNALDGTYRADDRSKSTIVIKDNRLFFSTIEGMEIIFDGETIILLGDVKYNFNDYCSNIWYYHFNSDGNLEIILNANKILQGFSNVIVFKPVP